MKQQVKFGFLGAIFAFFLVISSSASATLTTYTNRTDFQNALSEFTVDNLNGVTPYGHPNEVRSGYTITTQSVYGCIDQYGCGDNSSIGFDNAYLWNYAGTDTFTFSTPTNGFGVDYGTPVCCGSGSDRILLNGLQSPTSVGFFGVISDVALTQFTMDQVGNYMLFDNVTYGAAAASNVPEPESLSLVALALVGLGLVRRKANQA